MARNSTISSSSIIAGAHGARRRERAAKPLEMAVVVRLVVNSGLVAGSRTIGDKQWAANGGHLNRRQVVLRLLSRRQRLMCLRCDSVINIDPFGHETECSKLRRQRTVSAGHRGTASDRILNVRLAEIDQSSARW